MNVLYNMLCMYTITLRKLNLYDFSSVFSFFAHNLHSVGHVVHKCFDLQKADSSKFFCPLIKMD